MKKSIITSAVFNYLQNNKIWVDYSCNCRSTKSEEIIKESMDLRELTMEEVNIAVIDGYSDALENMAEISIPNLVKALGINLCNAWLAYHLEEKFVVGYNHANRFFDGLRIDESTTFYIA